MNKLTALQIVDGIRQRDNQVLSIIYKEVFPVVRYYVLNNSGNQEDAKDVFQEALIIIYKKVKNDSLELTSGFEAYLYGVSRMVWVKTLRNRGVHERSVVQLEEPEADYAPDEMFFEEDEELRLFRKHYRQLKPDCQKLLRMIAAGNSYDEIARKLGYKSEKIVRNKKFQCKQLLTKMIKADREYQEIIKRSKK